jgi:hypothetical protein
MLLTPESAFDVYSIAQKSVNILNVHGNNQVEQSTNQHWLALATKSGAPERFPVWRVLL